MKLTRYELVRAQDRQLAAIGLKRSGNSGWLADAMEREFTEQQIELFKGIRKARKPKVKPEKPLVSIEDEKERIERLSVCNRWLIEQIDAIHLALCPGQNGTWQQRTLQAVEAAKKLAAPRIVSTSAEDFANDLFKEVKGDLSL